MKVSAPGMVARIAIGCLLTCAAGVACADNFQDPTRPPESLGIYQQAGEGDISSGPRLQSVLISPGRKLAVISGKTFRVGDLFGEARVADIKESEVVLRNGNSTQTLKLFPEVQKRGSRFASASKPVASSSKVKDK